MDQRAAVNIFNQQQKLAQQSDSYKEYTLRSEIANIPLLPEEDFKLIKQGVIYCPYIPACVRSDDKESKLEDIKPALTRYRGFVNV